MSKSLLIRSIIVGFVLGSVLFGTLVPRIINADSEGPTSLNAVKVAGKSRAKFCGLDKSSYAITKTVKMVITAYTDIPELTDDTPQITASNKQVKYGMVATNIFKFGTKVRIPKVYGDEIFVVEDRMNSKYNGKSYLDIFLPTYKEAKNFGFEITEVQILES